MFILTTIEDLIVIKPHEFSKPSQQAIKDSINAKYANKVIQKVGLCICMWDLLSASDGLIGHGTGLVNVNVEFRMVVFRPFHNEIIQGMIKESDENGIRIDLDFTCEIFVPGISLFENSFFDTAENVWVWRNDGTDLYFDKGEPVRLRVDSEHWEDLGPGLGNDEDEEEEQPDQEVRSAYKIMGSMATPGLGPLLWWQGLEEGEGEEGEGEEEYEEMEE